MEASDLYTYETSSQSEKPKIPYQSKEWSYTIDANNGNYSSNQINFDLTTLFNTNKYISFGEMFITLPVIMVVSIDNAGSLPSGGQNDYTAGLKSGFHNLISSMSVYYNDKEVVQLTPNQNFYTSFKILSSMSQDEYNKIGQSIGVQKDTATGWAYITDANVRGNGLSNNNNNTALFVANNNQYRGLLYNEGLINRQLNTSFSLLASGGPNGAHLITSELNLNQQLKNYTKKIGSKAQVYYITATIRLKDLNSWFESMPLVKSGYMRMSLRVNQGSFMANRNSAGNSPTTLNGNNINFPNGTNPMMLSISSADEYGTSTEIVGGVWIQQVGSSLGSLNQNTLNIPSHPLRSARCYAPLITLNSDYEMEYIKANQKKLVSYTDILQYQILNIPAGSQFNQNLVNSLVGAKGLLVIPFLSSAIHGITTGIGTPTNTQPFSPVLSPFTCEPSVTSPLISLINLQVLLSNKAVLNNPNSYNFENFMIETYGANSINGGLSSITSGLIDIQDWEQIYRYYYVDLSRKLEGDKSPQSIAIYGTNNTIINIDLYIFVIYSKEHYINVETGALVS